MPLHHTHWAKRCQCYLLQPAQQGVQQGQQQQQQMWRLGMGFAAAAAAATMLSPAAAHCTSTAEAPSSLVPVSGPASRHYGLLSAP